MSTPGEVYGSANSRVLVAVMNSPRDFEIVVNQRWYRIPFARAPRRLGADFLAFYQTKAFAEEGWAINYYSAIRRYRLVPRRVLLPAEPDHPAADTLYYKIEVGPLLRLPHPIPSARLRRITFIPTLLKADEINDLWRGGPEEERLWLAFKEHGLNAERHYPLREQEPEYCLDFALFCKKGRMAILVENTGEIENVRVVRESPLVEEYEVAALGWTLLRLDSEEVRRALPSCFERILNAVQHRGGPMPWPSRCGSGASHTSLPSEVLPGP
jgi:very-short-patch-repair endonuclease